MDASNPVADSTRMTISAIRERGRRFRRQDLAWLNRVCDELKRNYLPTIPAKENPDEDEGAVMAQLGVIIEKHQEKLDAAKKHSLLDAESLDFLEPLRPIPVCGLMNDGVPLHPTGVHEAKGHVNNLLNFGGVGICKNTVSLLSRIIETEELIGVLETVPIFTMGTPQGLYERLKKQMTIPPKPPKISQSHFEKIMARAMPLNPNKSLINWNGDLYDLFENVETSYSSSAGAPYWRPKSEAVDDMLDLVLPKVAKALTNNTLKDLYKEQPELFVSIVKNKDDRYADPTTKTRPYLALPWHWQTLFSVLAQGFCKKLYLFHEKPGCRNAYGFSYANGGGNKLYQFATSTQPGEPNYCVYGDDVDFYFKTPDGKLYRVCPDFSQMDGSVDPETVGHTIDWIYNTYAKEFGENGFWKNVCELWKSFATDPLFLVTGTTPYKKKNKSGIMSGVVGTTLFDTVKAILAYEEFVAIYNNASQLMDAKDIIAYFKGHGLTVKEGTWKPTMVAPEHASGDKVTDLKFLGMQLLCQEYRGERIFVPVLEHHEWLNILVTPRDKKADSRTTKQRYLFDRLRGLLATGGAFDDKFRMICNTILNYIPPAAIVMQVQVNGGRGAKPELVKAVGEEFNWCDSQSFPTKEWALDLYAPPHLKDPEVAMFRIFDDPLGKLSNLPKRQPLQPKAAVLDLISGSEIITSTVVPVPEIKATPIVEDISSTAELAEPVDVPKLGEAKFDKKSVVSNYLPSTGEVITSTPVEVRGKIVDMPLSRPKLAQSIVDFLGPVQLNKAVPLESAYVELVGHIDNVRKKSGTDGLKQMLRENQWDFLDQTILSLALEGHPVDLLERWVVCLRQLVSLDSMAQRLGHPQKHVEEECRKLGYYVFGPKDYPYVTNVPIAPLKQEYAEQIQKQEKENVQNLNKINEVLAEKIITPETTKMIQQKKTLTDTVDRALEIPATLPTAQFPHDVTQQGEELPVLRKVADVKPEEALTQRKMERQICCDRILRGNDIIYRLDRVLIGEGPLQQFGFDVTWIRGDKEWLAYQVMGNNLIPYYDFVIKKYMFESGLTDESLSAANTDWFNLYALEREFKIRMYKHHGKPLAFYIKSKGPVVVDKSKGLTVQDGHLVYSSGSLKQELNLDNMSKSAQRLTSLLGDEVEVMNISYLEFKEQYLNFDKELGATEIFKNKCETIKQNNIKQKAKRVIYHNKHINKTKYVGTQSNDIPEQQQQKEGQKERSKSRSSSERKRSQGKKRSPKRAPSKTKMEYEKAQYPSGNNGRFRLPRNSSRFPHYQNWGGFVNNQHMPYGMGWYPGPTGSFPMAAVPPPFIGFGNNNISQQNDGRPIFGGMDGRLRGSRSHSGRGSSK
nr:MAG: RNA-dependent RNA polymerase [Permutotetraviridae sp.]